MSPATRPLVRPGDPARVMLIGGLVPAVVSGAVVALCAVILGTRTGAGVAVGGALALPALAVVPVLMRWTRGWPQAGVLVIAVLAHGVVMSLLWTAYMLVSGLPWLDPQAAGVGFATVTVTWSVGVMRAMRGLRQHLYDATSTPLR